MDELLDTLPCAVVSFTDEGVIDTTNATLGELLGYSAVELEGQRFDSLLTIAGRIFYQTHFFPLLKLHGRAQEIFLLLRHKDGSEVGALVNARRQQREGQWRNDCVMIEVRERRKYEDELLRARRAADSANTLLQEQASVLQRQQEQLQDQAAELVAQSEELQVANEELTAQTEELEQARLLADDANRAKSQFLATMSHELRTPLNAIAGYVQLIELGIYGPVTDEQRQSLGRILLSQRHLLRLINDILNLARIEAGRVTYAVDEISIADVIASVIPMVEPQMTAAGLAFTSAVEPDVIARADRQKVQQILINLLTNALKFTASGGRISVEAQRDTAAGAVMIRVADTGIGVASHKLKSIFEPFVQVDDGRTTRQEGTGLGLAISRDLAHGMDGDLTVESEPGLGSTFVLTLPGA
jgi:PAS domain S-box-containing protein